MILPIKPYNNKDESTSESENKIKVTVNSNWKKSESTSFCFVLFCNFISCQKVKTKLEPNKVKTKPKWK